MNKNYVPDLPLTPPEPEWVIAFSCAICNEPVYEGEDYYEIPELGKCCEDCIRDCKCYCAEREE